MSSLNLSPPLLAGPPKGETAAPGVGARNSGNRLKKLDKTSNAESRAKGPRLASLRLKGLFSDEGHFYGWEVAR